MTSKNWWNLRESEHGAIDNTLLYTAHPCPWCIKEYCGLKKSPDTARREKDSLCSALSLTLLLRRRRYADLLPRSICRSTWANRDWILLALVCSAANIENKCWKMQFNIYTVYIIFFHFTHFCSRARRLQLQNRTVSVNLIPLSLAARCWVPMWFANAGRDPAALLAPLIVELRAWDISTCTRYSLWEVNKLELPQNDEMCGASECCCFQFWQTFLLSRHYFAI